MESSSTSSNSATSTSDISSESAQTSYAQVSNAISDAYDQASDYASDKYDQASEVVANTYNQATEAASQVIEVGPVDAMVANLNAHDAVENAQASGLQDPHNGEQDALRHCDWSCQNAQDIGVEQAQQVGNLHEALTENNPPGEEFMDLHNNSVGYSLGANPEAYCPAACANALQSGELITQPDHADDFGDDFDDGE